MSRRPQWCSLLLILTRSYPLLVARELHRQHLDLHRQSSRDLETSVLYWYLHRFTRHWPFARTSTEAQLHQRLPQPLCSLSSCRATLAQTS